MVDEEVISVKGQIRFLSFVEWFFITITFGILYVIYYRKKKFRRTILVLTNKRILELFIKQRTGTITSNLHSVQISSVSYFPGKIKAGAMISEGKKVVNTKKRYH
jgi:hypothetical protein